MTLDGQRGGYTFDPRHDADRLNAQAERVFQVMRDGAWHTLPEVAAKTGDPEASVSARFRDFRKPQFGGMTVLRRRVTGGNGLHMYRLVVDDAMRTIAEQYPARTDSNGTTWWRSGSGPQDGWTAQRQYAHPSYGDPQPQENDARTPPTGPADRPALADVPGVQRATRQPVHATQRHDPHAGDVVPPGAGVEGRTARHRDAGEPVTAATDTGQFDVSRSTAASYARTTLTMGYPLPPQPPRPVMKFNQWRQYQLPSPTTGRPTGFPRSTTVADTLDETYNLSRYKRRETVRHIVAFMDLLNALDEGAALTDDQEAIVTRLARVCDLTPAEVGGRLGEAIDGGDGGKQALDIALDLIDQACGGDDAKELGGAVHAWLEAFDIGTVTRADVPEMFLPYLDAYLDVLARHGLVALPQYVERVVLNDRGEETVVGQIDRLFLVVATGEIVLGDVKTSKELSYSWLPYSVQFAVYGYATRMLKLDGSGWEPMPEIGTDYCLCIHVPSNQPERSSAVTFDLTFGGEAMVTSLTTRRQRKIAKNAVPYVHAIPTPTEAALAYAAAWQAVSSISHPDDLPGVWERFESVWTDDLTERGHAVAALITSTNTNTEE